MATASSLRLVTADEFLRMEFGSDLKAELDNGTIRMMAGGSREHARVQRNVLSWLVAALRGSGCVPFGSDAAVRPTGYSVRYPDVTVDCGPDLGPAAELAADHLSDPHVIVEVLSPTTRSDDEGTKLDEYRRMPRLRAIVYVDPAAQSVRVLEQLGVGRWDDTGDVVGGDAALSFFGLTIPHAEIFARD